MGANLTSTAIDKFLTFYREEMDTEIIDENNVILSFPVHFSGFHRVEVTVTHSSQDRFILSDGAKTLNELKNSGYDLNSKLKKRIEHISRFAEVRLVDDFLVTDTDANGLGERIQRFVEAAKTIGDAYLVQRSYSPRDTNLIETVSSFLAEQHVPFQVKRKLQGKVESHDIDFFFPPNGVPGLALSVINNPTRMAAEAWAFKAWDIKGKNDRIKVGVVYNSDDAADSSTSILKHSVDMSVPSSKISGLRGELKSLGILKRE